MSFSDFNLQPEFIKSIEAAGYQAPTPLQSELIPLVEGRKNVLVWTQSASGKTGAFLIPAMNYILENPAPEKRGARVLILTSRRDRVSQINYTIKRLSSDHVMRFGFIVSGRPYQAQMRLMRRPLDIMIATPGRLNDLMNNSKADFSQLEMLIIDDLTSIYKKNLQGLVEQIIKQAGDTCLTLTFVSEDENTNAYAQSLFPEAVQVNVDDESDDTAFRTEPHNAPQKGKQATQPTESTQKKIKKEAVPESVHKIEVPENLMAQKVYVADDYTHKIAMMDHLLDEFAGESTIIYTATNKAAKILQDNLSNHGHAAELIDDVESDEIKNMDILISSDQQKTVLDADVYPHIDSHIIHFDLPRKTEQYLKRLSHHHRDRDDEALLMVDGYNFNELKHIEKTLGESLSQITVPGLESLNPFVNLSKGKPSHNRSNSKNPNQARNKNPQNRNAKNKNNRSNNKPRPNAKNGKANKPRARNKNTTQNNSNSSGQNSNQEQGDNLSDPQRRQRKGAFGRLNGGAQRKRSNGRDSTNTTRSTGGGRHSYGRTGGRNVKVGVSTRGTAPPSGSGDRGWKADPQERKVEKSKVVIRYSKKRLIDDKPDDA